MWWFSWLAALPEDRSGHFQMDTHLACVGVYAVTVQLDSRNLHHAGKPGQAFQKVLQRGKTARQIALERRAFPAVIPVGIGSGRGRSIAVRAVSCAIAAVIAIVRIRIVAGRGGRRRRRRSGSRPGRGKLRTEYSRAAGRGQMVEFLRELRAAASRREGDMTTPICAASSRLRRRAARPSEARWRVVFSAICSRLSVALMFQNSRATPTPYTPATPAVAAAPRVPPGPYSVVLTASLRA